jgi:hypothetical protein
MIEKIIFYNHAHNGDVFISKSYISYIANSLPNIDFTYAHINDRKIVIDMPIKYSSDLNGLDQFSRWSGSEDTLYINSWVGNHLHYGDCNWKTLHSMYHDVINFINKNLDSNLYLSDIINYCPTINWKSYDIPKNFETEFNNTVIFSNGPTLSGQSDIYDIDKIVWEVVKSLPEKKFILTHPSSALILKDQVLLASDIIKTSGSDLNEISWLSTKCKNIVGRQSGPFIYMLVPENINDSRKTITGFGKHETTAWLYDVEINASYTMILEQQNDIVAEIVSEILK